MSRKVSWPPGEARAPAAGAGEVRVDVGELPPGIHRGGPSHQRPGRVHLPVARGCPQLRVLLDEDRVRGGETGQVVRGGRPVWPCLLVEPGVQDRPSGTLDVVQQRVQRLPRRRDVGSRPDPHAVVQAHEPQCGQRPAERMTGRLAGVRNGEGGQHPIAGPGRRVGAEVQEVPHPGAVLGDRLRGEVVDRRPALPSRRDETTPDQPGQRGTGAGLADPELPQNRDDRRRRQVGVGGVEVLAEHCRQQMLRARPRLGPGHSDVVGVHLIRLPHPDAPAAREVGRGKAPSGAGGGTIVLACTSVLTSPPIPPTRAGWPLRSATSGSADSATSERS